MFSLTLQRRKQPQATGHVVLLGDSILDNAAYTHFAPDVTAHLTGLLPRWDVTNAAIDGATTRSIEWQYEHIPADTTHLIISVGGNDAMSEIGLLTDENLYLTREVMEDLAVMGSMFAMDYEAAVSPLLGLAEVTVCTIYDCDFPEHMKLPVRAGIAMFNDAITRYAARNSVRLLDLRAVCTEPSDYERQIEPSATGGAKIAAAIARHLEG